MPVLIGIPEQGNVKVVFPGTLTWSSLESISKTGQLLTLTLMWIKHLQPLCVSLNQNWIVVTGFSLFYSSGKPACSDAGAQR